MVYGLGKGAARCRQKSRNYFVEVDAPYDKGIQEAKAIPVAGESPGFVSVEVDIRYDKGIRETEEPPVASKVSSTFWCR